MGKEIALVELETLNRGATFMRVGSHTIFTIRRRSKKTVICLSPCGNTFRFYITEKVIVTNLKSTNSEQ